MRPIGAVKAGSVSQRPRTVELRTAEITYLDCGAAALGSKALGRYTGNPSLCNCSAMVRPCSLLTPREGGSLYRADAVLKKFTKSYLRSALCLKKEQSNQAKRLRVVIDRKMAAHLVKITASVKNKEGYQKPPWASPVVPKSPLGRL